MNNFSKSIKDEDNKSPLQVKNEASSTITSQLMRNNPIMTT
jgi:hypothetical protein